ncbi:hypothetical protein HMPREF3196_00083 [Bifidobacterium bifidum]|uniref:Uncharacterized protein n=1 Tax=Bifidobacterium bifidum TaxID=1681 RepID=A0A133KUB2_BIFBI|nr:hypothetical protein HMPREF3196_00083 [Bifidobacterium bifidum]
MSSSFITSDCLLRLLLPGTASLPVVYRIHERTLRSLVAAMPYGRDYCQCFQWTDVMVSV